MKRIETTPVTRSRDYCYDSPLPFLHTRTHSPTCAHSQCDMIDRDFTEFFLYNLSYIQITHLLFLKVRNVEKYTEGKKLPIITECIDPPLLLFGLLSSNIISKTTVGR